MRHDRRDAAHGAEWRDPAGVVAQWSDAGTADPELLAMRARDGWWDALSASGATLIVSREYEHLLLAISGGERPAVSYLRLPHPCGVAFDQTRSRVFVASTRNPNQIFELARASGGEAARCLVPVRTWLLPGRAYVHDIAVIGGRLHVNAVGLNAIAAVEDDGMRVVWWPASVERDGRPITDRNVLQMNSIAAGGDLASSYFSASAERPGRYPPGHPRFPVDRCGVIFSGATREAVVRGLTRPHSARLHGERLWVDDSGYGEVGVADGERFEAVARLPGWTRGLGFAGGVAFVGTSRVIPRFAHYAPGLDTARSRCAIHAVDVRTGAVRGSLEFPYGNQIYGIETLAAGWTTGFPFARGAGAAAARDLFYAFSLDDR